MKYLMIVFFLSLATILLSQTYTGNWKVNTMGSGNEATISQNKNKISVFRILKQEFEGEQYILYHLMKGNINDKKLKLYVKEDKLDKFEYLRDVTFKKDNINTLKIDDKIYTRVKKIRQENLSSNSNKDSDNKVEIIYLKKKPSENNNVARKESTKPKIIEYEDNSKTDDSSIAEKNNEPSFILPAGLGDAGNKELRKIKISSGFSSEENALNMKAIRLMKRKHYNRAIKIFLNLYKKNSNNISLLIKLESTYSLVGNKKEAKKYCKKIKRYDPFYLCGD